MMERCPSPDWGSFYDNPPLKTGKRDRNQLLGFGVYICDPKTILFVWHSRCIAEQKRVA